jgi:hypothetical protein
MIAGTILGGAGLALGLGSMISGAASSRSARKRQKREQAKQRAASEAWYMRNYYQDYLNTVSARNALKRYRDEWAERAQQARSRQAITGGTPEQAVAVEEAGGEAMANMIGNLAAQGERNKQAIDAQKLAMDTNIAQQEAAMASAEQAAGANLVSNGVGMIASSLTGLGESLSGAEQAVAPTEVPKVETPVIKTPETSTRVNAPAVVGKEAGINPELTENPAEEVYQFYTKNPNVGY